MRLDCIVSEILNTSRKIAEDIINAGRVFVNYEETNKLTKQIKEGDLITIRGKGKFELAKVNGSTKSNRVRLWFQGVRFRGRRV